MTFRPPVSDDEAQCGVNSGEFKLAPILRLCGFTERRGAYLAPSREMGGYDDGPYEVDGVGTRVRCCPPPCFACDEKRPLRGVSLDFDLCGARTLGIVNGRGRIGVRIDRFVWLESPCNQSGQGCGACRPLRHARLCFALDIAARRGAVATISLALLAEILKLPKDVTIRAVHQGAAAYWRGDAELSLEGGDLPVVPEGACAPRVDIVHKRVPVASVPADCAYTWEFDKFVVRS